MTPSLDQPDTPASTSRPLRTAERERRALSARVAALYEGREQPTAAPATHRAPRPIRYSGLRDV